MIKVKNTKTGKEFTYNSLADACNQNGANSQKNRPNAIKFLEKMNLKLIYEDKKYKRKPKSVSIVDRIIKLAQTVDKEKLKAKQSELETAYANMEVGSDITHIVKLRDQVEKLKNPTVNKKTYLDKCAELWEIAQKKRKEVEDQTETETAPKKQTKTK